MADERVRVSIIVRSVEVVHIEHGAWCPACALPSAATIVLASTRTDGTLQLSTGVRCLDGCGWLRS